MSRPFIHANKKIIAQYIEFFLCLALHVDGLAAFCRLVSVHATELTHGDGACNRFARQCHVQNQAIEFAFGVRKATTFFNQVLGQGSALT